MKHEDLLSFLQDIVEEDGNLTTLKYRYTIYGYGTYSLDILKKIVIYGLEKQLFVISKYIRNTSLEDSYYEDFNMAKSIEVVECNNSWEVSEYNLCFSNIPHYFFILFGPNGPVGDHAMEGAKIPEEFEQFVIDE